MHTLDVLGSSLPLLTLALVVLLCSGCQGARLRRELPSPQDGDTVKQVVKFEKDVATLSCGLGAENGIMWLDKVHNSGEDAQLIFDSRSNPSRQVDASHPLIAQITVNEDNSISISGLMSDQAGQYYCQTPDALQREWFEIIIIERPECTGKTETFYEGHADTEKYTCVANFRGNVQPEVQILVGEEVMPTMDDSFIKKAKRDAFIVPVARFDGKVVTCRVKVADIMEDCIIGTFKVMYQTTNLTGSAEPYLAGEDYSCQAKGNPAPHITMTTSDGDKKMGQGSVTHTILDTWTGKKDVWIQCMGHNEYNDASGMLVKGHAEMNNTITVERPLESGNPEDKPKPEAGTSGGNGDKTVATGTIFGLSLVFCIAHSYILS